MEARQFLLNVAASLVAAAIWWIGAQMDGRILGAMALTAALCFLFQWLGKRFWLDRRSQRVIAGQARLPGAAPYNVTLDESEAVGGQIDRDSRA